MNKAEVNGKICVWSHKTKQAEKETVIQQKQTNRHSKVDKLKQ